ncbi:MAG TPA: peptidoglycan DD-metalloendopeptidase family protein, partial [Sphingomonas sp.]
VRDLVHLRAVLGTALPVIAARTATIRAQVEAARQLQASALSAAEAQRAGRARLEAERTALARLEARHRARAGALGRTALSEADRALALGEQARDLVDQMSQETDAALIAEALSRLPGPTARPVAGGGVAAAGRARAYRLPVDGRLVTGFGEVSAAGVRARGLTFAVADGARVVAPAGGIVRFAGRFRSFGTIVILDHGDGWSTLVAGLSATPLAREQGVAMGEPLGVVRGADARVTVELRRRGRPVDLLALTG